MTVAMSICIAVFAVMTHRAASRRLILAFPPHFFQIVAMPVRTAMRMAAKRHSNETKGGGGIRKLESDITDVLCMQAYNTAKKKTNLVKTFVFEALQTMMTTTHGFPLLPVGDFIKTARDAFDKEKEINLSLFKLSRIPSLAICNIFYQASSLFLNRIGTIKDLELLQPLEKLERIALEGNNLKTFPIPLLTFKVLRYVHISNNAISRLVFPDTVVGSATIEGLYMNGPNDVLHKVTNFEKAFPALLNLYVNERTDRAIFAVWPKAYQDRVTVHYKTQDVKK